MEKHMHLLQLALEEAKKCTPSSTAFCVGALLVNAGGNILSTGYSRELPGNTHAEQVCLQKLGFRRLPAGSACYTTMEPCSERLSGNKPCVDNLIEAGVEKVYMGVKEPDTFVKCVGVDKLQEAGIEVTYVPGLEIDCMEVAIRGHKGR